MATGPDSSSSPFPFIENVSTKKDSIESSSTLCQTPISETNPSAIETTLHPCMESTEQSGGDPSPSAIVSSPYPCTESVLQSGIKTMVIPSTTGSNSLAAGYEYRRTDSESSLSDDSGFSMDNDIHSKCPCGSTSFIHSIDPPPECLAERHSRTQNFSELKINGQSRSRVSKRAMIELEKHLVSATKLTNKKFVTYRMAAYYWAQSIPDIKNSLKQIVLSHYQQQKVGDDFESLFDAATIGANFINYDIIRDHIMVACRNLCSRMSPEREAAEDAEEQYRKYFLDFSQHRVFSCPNGLDVHPQAGESLVNELMIKVEKDHNSFIFEDIDSLREAVRTILKLPESVKLVVTTVKEGCVQITFNIYDPEVKPSFSLTLSQKRALIKKKIIRLEFNKEVKYCYHRLPDDEETRKAIEDIKKLKICEVNLQTEEEQHTLDCQKQSNECYQTSCIYCGQKVHYCVLQYHSISCEVENRSTGSDSMNRSDAAQLDCESAVFTDQDEYHSFSCELENPRISSYYMNASDAAQSDNEPDSESELFTEQDKSWVDKRKELHDQYYTPDPELDSFDKLLARKKSWVDKRKELHDHYSMLLKEKNTLKERLSLVDEDFVVIMGTEDLEQQTSDLKKKISLLEATTDVYKNDFEEERAARAYAHGQIDELQQKFKLEKQMLQQQIQELRKQLDAYHRQGGGGGSGGGTSQTSCQKCPLFQQRVQELQGKNKRLVQKLSRSEMELVDLNELRAHEKDLEQRIIGLEQETARSWVDKRKELHDQYYTPDLELDSFDKLLASKKSWVDKRKELHDQYSVLLKEKNTLKERLSLVDKNFVVIMGIEDLEQQISDLKNKISLLEATIDIYKNDFEEERAARAYAHGQIDELQQKFKLEKQMLQQQIQELRKQPDAYNREGGGGGSGGDTSQTSCQKCPLFQQRVQELEGKNKRLVQKLSHSEMELVYLNELRAHEKNLEQRIIGLEQENAQLKQGRAFQDMNSSLHGFRGQERPVQSVGGGIESIMSTIPIYRMPKGSTLPPQLQNPHSDSDAQRTAATLPRYNRFSAGNHNGGDEGPPLRAKDPLIRSNSENRMLNRRLHYPNDHSNSPHEVIFESPAMLPTAPRFSPKCLVPLSEESLDNNPFPISQSDPLLHSRATSLSQQGASNREKPNERPLSQDDEVHHAYPGRVSPSTAACQSGFFTNVFDKSTALPSSQSDPLLQPQAASHNQPAPQPASNSKKPRERPLWQDDEVHHAYPGRVSHHTPSLAEFNHHLGPIVTLDSHNHLRAPPSSNSQPSPSTWRESSINSHSPPPGQTAPPIPPRAPNKSYRNAQSIPKDRDIDSPCYEEKNSAPNFSPGSFSEDNLPCVFPLEFQDSSYAKSHDQQLRESQKRNVPKHMPSDVIPKKQVNDCTTDIVPEQRVVAQSQTNSTHISSYSHQAQVRLESPAAMHSKPVPKQRQISIKDPKRSLPSYIASQQSDLSQSYPRKKTPSPTIAIPSKQKLDRAQSFDQSEAYDSYPKAMPRVKLRARSYASILEHSMVIGYKPTDSAPPLEREPRMSVLESGLPEEIFELNNQTDSRKQPTNEHAPFNPDLKCFVCEKMFRFGEMQKCAAHIRECKSQKEEEKRKLRERAFQDVNSSLHGFRSRGQERPVLSVGGGIENILSTIPIYRMPKGSTLPPQSQNPRSDSDAQQTAATLPRHNRLPAGNYYGDDKGPPLRAKAPLIRSHSENGMLNRRFRYPNDHSNSPHEVIFEFLAMLPTASRFSPQCLVPLSEESLDNNPFPISQSDPLLHSRATFHSQQGASIREKPKERPLSQGDEVHQAYPGRVSPPTAPSAGQSGFFTNAFDKSIALLTSQSDPFLKPQTASHSQPALEPVSNRKKPKERLLWQDDEVHHTYPGRVSHHAPSLSEFNQLYMTHDSHNHLRAPPSSNSQPSPNTLRESSVNSHSPSPGQTAPPIPPRAPNKSYRNAHSIPKDQDIDIPCFQEKNSAQFSPGSYYLPCVFPLEFQDSSYTRSQQLLESQKRIVPKHMPSDVIPKKQVNDYIADIVSEQRVVAQSQTNSTHISSYSHQAQLRSESSAAMHSQPVPKQRQISIKKNPKLSLPSIAPPVDYQLALDPCEAAKQGNIAEVRYLLLKGADLNYNLYRSGRWTKEDMLIAQRRLPPLHSARKAGLLKITTLLIEKGADVNRGDGHVLMSPLSLACENGCYKVIKYLAEEGKAKTEVIDCSNRTPLHKACASACDEVARYLRTKCTFDIMDAQGETPSDLFRQFKRWQSEMSSLSEKSSQGSEIADSSLLSTVGQNETSWCASNNDAVSPAQKPCETSSRASSDKPTRSSVDTSRLERGLSQDHIESVSRTKLFCEQFELICVEVGGTVMDEHVCAIYEQLDNWMLAAHHLRLTRQDIRDIKATATNPSEEKQMGLYVLLKWKEIRKALATYAALIEALLNCGCSQLAAKVCQLLQQTESNAVTS